MPTARQPIQPMLVERDEYGFWTHPGFPVWDEDATSEEVKAWFEQQGLTYLASEMEYEVDTDADPYFEGGDGSFAHWNPQTPAGEGWFILSIHDTECGPVCVWVREKTAA